MIIFDLEHQEAVCAETRIEGGLQLVSGSSTSESGAATTGSVSINGYSNSKASQYTSYYGTTTSTSAYSYNSGSTSPYPYY